MAGALSAPVLIGALVLCAAGGAKLVWPSSTRAALRTLGFPAGAWAVRALAAAELGIGGSCLIAGGRAAPLAMAAVYACFAIAAVRLARGHQPCGCFGVAQAPSSAWHAALSGVLATAAGLAALWPIQALGSVLSRPPGTIVATLLGLAGAAYAVVLAYTRLPSAWEAWRRS